LRPRGLT